MMDRATKFLIVLVVLEINLLTTNQLGCRESVRAANCDSPLVLGSLLLDLQQTPVAYLVVFVVS